MKKHIIMNSLFPKKAAIYSPKFLFMLLFACSLTACVKDVSSPISPSPNPQIPIPGTQGLRGIFAADNFTWQTVKPITITVVPMPVTSNEKLTLEIRTTNDELVFAHRMAMNESFTEKIVVPTNATFIKMKYGSIEKSIDIVNNMASLDFSQPIPDQYK